MIEEQYLLDIQNRANDAQDRLLQLQQLIAKETIEYNKIKSEREKAENYIKKFASDEIDSDLNRIRASRISADEFEKKHADKLREFIRGQEFIEIEKRELAAIRDKFELREIELNSSAQITEELYARANMNLARALELMASNDNRSQNLLDAQREMESMLAAAQDKYSSAMKFSAENTSILAQKQEMLDRERYITLNERRLLQDKEQYLKEWEDKLRLDWESLIITKKKIDEQRTSRQ